MIDWLREMKNFSANGDAFVVVTVATVRGSAPREAGAKLLLNASSVLGSIGGGHLEYKAIEIARNMLAGPALPTVYRFPLGATLGQCCGGVVNLFIERVEPGFPAWLNMLPLDEAQDCLLATAAGSAPASKMVIRKDLLHGTLGDAELDNKVATQARDWQSRGGKGATLLELPGAPGTCRTILVESLQSQRFPLILFGAGHVGRALVSVLQDVACNVTWVDSRADAFPAQIPDNVRVEITDAPEAEVDASPAGAYFLVMTHSHALDFEICTRILARDDFAWFGLIGSASKRSRFERRWQQRGVENSGRMTCPIGISTLQGKEPATIAIGVAAQLLQLREKALNGDALYERDRMLESTGTV